MSRMYNDIQSHLMNECDQTFEDALAELAAVDPEFAKRLADVEWEEVLVEVAQKAMDAAARRCRCRVAQSYGGHNHVTRTRRNPHAREYAIGALTTHPRMGQDRGPELGVYLEDNRVVFYWDWEEDEGNDALLKEWQLAFKHFYVEFTMAAYMHFIKAPGAIVERHETEHGVLYETVMSVEE